MFPIELFRNTVVKAVEIFDRHSIPYHLTGGTTSMAYGEPRMTQDVDMVIGNQAASDRLQPFLESLAKSDFIFEGEAIRSAIKKHGMFQLFDQQESLKLDIYSREMIAGELSRSQRYEVFDGLELPIACRADVAASKLVWIDKGSHKSRRDLRHIVRTGTDEDRRQLQEFADKAGLRSLLDEVLNESDEIRD